MHDRHAPPPPFLPQLPPTPHPATEAVALPFPSAVPEGDGAGGDVELLASVLGTPLATSARLLEAAGGLAALAREGTPDVAGLRLGRARRRRLLASLELGRRATLAVLDERRPTVGCLEATVRWARPRLAGLDHEEVWALLLDGRNGLRRAVQVARGGTHGCALTPRDVFRPAILSAASALVLVHNHPSGDPAPSHADLEMTQAVAAGGELLGVPLLDHVIVARDGECSLLELGVLD